MQRAFPILLLLAFVSAASAGTRPQMSGDARIDAQWAQLRRAPAVSPSPRQAARPPVRREIDPAFLPAVVEYPTAERPGTVVIDTRSRYLYLVLEGGKAQRYGVGVGREG